MFTADRTAVEEKGMEVTAVAATASDGAASRRATVAIDALCGETPAGSPAAAAPAPERGEGDAQNASNGNGNGAVQGDASAVAAANASQATKGEEDKRKRERGRKRKHAGAAAESADFLLQFALQLLKSQELEYEVRARELDDKVAAQAQELEAWERRTRALKRQLHELSYDEDATTRASLKATGSGSFAIARSANAAQPSTASLVPAGVAAIERSVQQVVDQRAKRMEQFAESLPRDFKQPLDQRISRIIGLKQL